MARQGHSERLTYKQPTSPTKSSLSAFNNNSRSKNNGIYAGNGGVYSGFGAKNCQKGEKKISSHTKPYIPRTMVDLQQQSSKI